MAIENFSVKKKLILLTTEGSFGRGIDIQDIVNVVITFPPEKIEDFV